MINMGRWGVVIGGVDIDTRTLVASPRISSGAEKGHDAQQSRRWCNVLRSQLHPTKKPRPHHSRIALDSGMLSPFTPNDP
jgi:hypothetical protein